MSGKRRGGAAPVSAPSDLPLREVVREVERLFGEACNGTFVGESHGQPQLGFIREDKRAVRFTAPTWRAALRAARLWREQRQSLESWVGPGYPDRWANPEPLPPVTEPGA